MGHSIPTVLWTGDLGLTTTTHTEGENWPDQTSKTNIDLILSFRPDYGQGIEDKWRNTYPYVPTSYYYNNPAMPRHQPESIGMLVEKTKKDKLNFFVSFF